jgi:aspartate/methionine/tyrosine aminotransferase
MELPEFKLERFFARWEFAVPHLLCASDIEGWRMADLLAMADDESRRLWAGLSLGYTESSGHPALRAAIAGLYADVAPEEVLTFAGAEEAIYLLMRAVLGPGDHAVVVWPAYQSLHAVARAAGAEVTLVGLRPDEGWALDLGRVRAALRPTTRLIAANFPHNPTGALPDHATFAALVALAADTGAVLLSDEVYRLLEFDAADRLPAAVDLSRSAVSLGVMSKAYGLAGLRVGWLACHDAALLRRVARLKDYTTICNSAPSEILALIALRQGASVLARSRAIVAGNLVVLDRFFAEWGEVMEWVRPRAGSIAFPRLRVGGPIDRLVDDLAREAGVLLLPGSVYDYPGDYFRLGLGRTSLPAALAALEGFLARRLGR